MSVTENAWSLSLHLYCVQQSCQRVPARCTGQLEVILVQPHSPFHLSQPFHEDLTFIAHFTGAHWCKSCPGTWMGPSNIHASPNKSGSLYSVLCLGDQSRIDTDLH